MIVKGLFLRNFDWGSLGLSVGRGLVNSLFGLGGSLISNDQQKALMQRQYEYQKDFFNYTSEYNSPFNQVKRLEEAGINPALSLGQIQTLGGLSGSIPNASRPNPQMGQVDFNKAMLESAQRRQFISQSDYTRAETDKTRAEAIGILYDNYRKAFMNKDERMQEEFANQMRVLSTQADMQANTADLRLSETRLIEVQQVTELAKQYNINADSALKLEEMLNKREERKNIIATYDKILSETGVNNANKFVLGLVAEKMKVEKPFWHTNAYNESSKLIQEALRTGELTDAKINDLKEHAKALQAQTAEGYASTGSQVADVLLNLVDLFIGSRKPKKVGF